MAYGHPMQISDEHIRAIATWATPIDAIAAIWLFGSRARGDALADSDYDLAIELMPVEPAGDDDPFIEFFYKWRSWKVELIAILNSDVDLVPYRQGWKTDFNVCTALLWSRSYQTV
jgi:predicted nucleotidyltransferase